MPTLFKVVLLACLWGPSYLFIKLAVGEIPPVTMQVGRVGIAALLMLVIVAIKGTTFPRDLRIWSRLLVMSMLSVAIPFTLIAYGEQYVESSMAAIIQGVTPGFTAITAHYFLHDEKLTWQKVWGIAIGLSGFLFLLVPTLTDLSVDSDTIGLFSIFIACASYGGAMVFARKYLRGLPPLVAPTGQLLLATSYLIPLALFLENPLALPALSWLAIGSVLFLAIMGTAAAFVLYYHIIETAGATATSSVAYLLPVIGTLLGVAIRGEIIGATGWLAMGVILFGMYLINRD